MNVLQFIFIGLVFFVGYTAGMVWAIWKERNLPDGEYAHGLELALMEFSTRIDDDGHPCWCTFKFPQQHEGVWQHAPRCLYTRKALEL